MSIINNQFRLNLDIFKREFVDKLIFISKNQENVDKDIISSDSYKYIGTLDFNSFRLIKNKSTFFNINFSIAGEISEKNEQVQIDGEIEGHIFTLLFVLTYTTICCSFA